ncbi:MAG TPA: cell division protein ZapA [Usitatibacter sp.]|nr:cell division protein ZapA [Usitatibacter sp.]
MSAEDRRERGAMTINLMGREFRVACPEGEEKQLQASVEYLNRKLKEVRDTGKVTGNERIAIMAALNIAHEMMSNNGKGNGAAFDGAAYRRRILAMQETLDSALAADQENLF